MYQELLKIVAEKKVVEDRITIQRAKMEKFIEVDVASLSDLKIKEENLRKEVYDKIKEEEKENVTIGNKMIIPQVRITKRYSDPERIQAAILSMKTELEELGLEPERIAEECFGTEKIITNKKTIIDVVDKFQKVEGRLLDGVEEKKTEFLTIKDK